MLRINDKNLDLIALICSTMPEDIRRRLMRDLNIIYEQGIFNKDTQAEGERNDFESVHFSYYTRYSTRVHLILQILNFVLIFICWVQGDNTPAESEPTTLRKEGKKKTHMSQSVPHPSQEMLEHSEEYKVLQTALAPFCNGKEKWYV